MIYTTNRFQVKFDLTHDEIADILFNYVINVLPESKHYNKISKNLINKVVRDNLKQNGYSDFNDLAHYRAECLNCPKDFVENQKINQHIAKAILKHYS